MFNGERRQPTSIPVWPVTVEKPVVGTTRARLRYVIRSSRDRKRGRDRAKMTYSPRMGLRGLQDEGERIVIVNSPAGCRGKVAKTLLFL